MSKSPFVTKEQKTYKYPEPMSVEEEDRFVERNPGYSRKIDPEVLEDNHWITIRIPRSRADVDAVADATQSLTVLGDGDGAKFEQRIAKGNRAVFELLVEAWSFDAEPNGANYARLGDWAGDWVAACLADVVKLGTSRDYAKKMNNSSPKPEPSPIKPSELEPTESV